MAPARPGLDDLVGATPAGRDRVVDLLRAASILAVVFGHWLIAAVIRVDGEVETTNALGQLGWLRPLTWVFQVMPIFFLVGGFANHRSLQRARETGEGWPGFLARRADRLLRPTLVFAVAWLLTALVLDQVVDDRGLVRDVARVAAQPLWFLAVYALVVLAAPAQLALHRRHPTAVLVGLPVLVVGLDALRLNELGGDIAYVNYLAVFLVAQELGFWYADGRLAGVPARTAAAVGGLALLVLIGLTTVGPYPVSMIGLPGQRISNMSPPTVCILVLTVAQGGLLLAAHDPLQRWLERPWVWRPVVLANLVVLTLFLWHLTALVVVGGVVLALDLPLPDIGTAAWWAHHLLWLVAAAVVLAGLVALFSPVERLPSDPRPRGPGVLRAVGMVLAALGLTGFALAGFARPASTAGRELLGVRASPLASLVLLVVGWLLAAGLPRRGRGPAAAEAQPGPPAPPAAT